MPSESTREGQAHRYYEPWVHLQNSSHLLGQNAVQRSSDAHGSVAAPRASRDKALTAFAQLATLRLNVKRAMVSLIDSSTQYILAEATRTLSLATNTSNVQEDQLWLGSSCIPTKTAVCPLTFDSTYMAEDEEGNTLTANALVVEDMRLDDRFKDREYVKNGGVMFYAGVPIRTSSGVRIGVYGVSDPCPRKKLDVDELRFMQDVAVAIFEHLDLTKARFDHIRGERLVRGFTAFIEGRSTLSDNVDPRSRPESRVPVESGKTTSHVEPKYGSKHAEKSKEKQICELFTRAARLIRESTNADGVVFLDATSQVFQTELPSDRILEGDISTAEKPNEVDVSDSDHGHRRRGLPTRMAGGTSTGRAYHEADHKLSSSGSDTSPTRKSLCDVFGVSLSGENPDSDSNGSKAFSIQIRDLNRYLHRYPSGKIFNLQQDSTSSGDDTTSDHTDGNDTMTSAQRHAKSSKRMRFHKAFGAEIAKRLPGARSVVFLPMWDFAHDRWLAGAFIWTAQKGRLLDAADDIPYLKAFANSIASEVSRLTSMHSEHAKTTFIASISHELRSPLHGILGSIEFLHDTSIDAYQSGLISSVETCGKTLLDTINHVLDYAGINDFAANGKNAESTRGNQPKSRYESTTDLSPSLTTDFDLAILVEEVTDAIFTGRLFSRANRTEALRYTSRQTLPRSYSSPVDTVQVATEANSSAIHDPATRPVTVLLNITKDAKWDVRSQPGALRRVIMNLFGNALKYTERGFVEVSLKAFKDHRQNARIRFELKLTDSGRGMSEEYQREKLYRPFSQEDPFAEGTGLGLSIVRQLVDSLKGKIKVKSQERVGTEVTVLFSLPLSRPVPHAPPAELQSVTPIAKGLKVCILDSNTEGVERTPEASRRLEASLRETCLDWFEIQVVKENGADTSDADIAFFLESPSAEYFWRLNAEDLAANGSKKLTPMVILCQNAYETSGLKQQLFEVMKSRRVFQIIAQPCGPRKLAKAFEQCLKPASPATNQTVSLPNHSKEGSSHLSRLSTVMPDLCNSAPNETNTSVPSLTTATMSSLFSTPTPPKSAPRILLVDDNAINLKLLTTFMTKLHFPHTSARNGLEALNAYKAADGAFDFVLMDISMPVMDGLMATREIRKWEKERGRGSVCERPAGAERVDSGVVEAVGVGVGGGNPAKEAGIEQRRSSKGGGEGRGTTILALTGLASAAAREDAFASGVDGFLPKPVVFKELRVLLEQGFSPAQE